MAECHPPFPPLPPGALSPAEIAAHALADRLVGVLLVRLGGYAAGVFGPGQALLASKVGSRLVHGRSAAGGTSQHRFARRREKQSREALGAAASTAAAVFAPVARAGSTRSCSAVTGARSPGWPTTRGCGPTSASPSTGS